MNERRNGTYVACKFTPKSCEALMSWCESVGMLNTIAVDKLHSTILYSRVPLEELHGDLTSWVIGSNEWTFTPKAFRVFDENKLAVELEAPKLVELHTVLKSLGGTHDFPDYVPHVTLSYNVSGFDLSTPLPAVLLEVSKVYAEPLNLNWGEEHASVD